MFGAVSPVPDAFAKFQLRGFVAGSGTPRSKYSSGEEAGDLGDGVSRIYAGFIPDLSASGARSRRGTENYRQEANEIDCGFISDLCRIYSPFRRFKVEWLKKRGP